MSNEEKLPSDEDIEGLPEPDTDTGEGVPAMEAIPVAEPEAPAAPAASAAQGPRIFPQQFTMLFANTCILVGTLTVWERGTVTNLPDRYGFTMIGGAFVLAISAYCVLTGLIGLIRGGVRFASTLLSGFFGLYFGIKSLIRLVRLENFLLYGDFKETMGTQTAVEAFLGQIGPGIYLNLLGGLVIIWMFLKAMFGKKKQPEPAPRRRR
jgi:hypothetical protein